MRNFTARLFWPFFWVKAHWKLSALVLVGLLLLGFWQYRRTQANEVILTFVKPERGTLTKTLEISGVVDAKEKARLRFLAGGKVVYLGAKEGDWVKKWQTIASIDKTQLQKQLQQDLNAYMSERLEWDQTNDDIDEGEFTKAEDRTKQQAQLDLNNEVLDVEIKTTAIRDSALYAPFEGIVTLMPTTTPGVQLAASDYFEIVNPTTLIFKAYVDEVDIKDVKIGQPAELTLDAYADETVATTVQYIAFASSQTTTGTVFITEFSLAQSDLAHFRLGMNGDISITTDKVENTLSIPLDATRERDGTTYVDFRTGENTFEEREIKIGLTTDDRVEVLSGLSENDEIVLPD